MVSLMERILVFLKIVKKTGRRKKLPSNYIQNHNRYWRVFGIVVLYLSLSSYGSTINWEISQAKDSGALVYGFNGDNAFRLLLISSIQNNTFSTFISNNTTKQLGVYSANSSGYVKSANFTVPNSTKTYDVFIVALDTSDVNSYSKAYVFDVKTQNIAKTGVNTFSFNGSTGSFSTVYPVPEPTVTSMLLFSTFIIVCRRPKIV